MSIKIGTKVKFSWPLSDVDGHTQEGSGEVISSEDGTGHVFVAQDATAPEGRRFVLYCALTWLTPIVPADAPTTPATPAA